MFYSDLRTLSENSRKRRRYFLDRKELTTVELFRRKDDHKEVKSLCNVDLGKFFLGRRSMDGKTFFGSLIYFKVNVGAAYVRFFVAVAIAATEK